MRIDAKTAIWVTSDPGPHSTLPDICFETTLDGLRLSGDLDKRSYPA